MKMLLKIDNMVISDIVSNKKLIFGGSFVSDSKPTVVHNLSFPAILLLKEQKEESVSECTLQP